MASRSLYIPDNSRPIAIEGELKKYKNKLSGYCKRYFLIWGEILEYYHSKADLGKKRPKWVSLECADIVPKWTKDIKISSGLQDLYIRFDSETQKQNWLEEFRKAIARANLAIKTNTLIKEDAP